MLGFGTALWECVFACWDLALLCGNVSGHVKIWHCFVEMCLCVLGFGTALWKMCLKLFKYCAAEKIMCQGLFKVFYE